MSYRDGSLFQLEFTDAQGKKVSEKIGQYQEEAMSDNLNNHPHTGSSFGYRWASFFEELSYYLGTYADHTQPITIRIHPDRNSV